MLSPAKRTLLLVSVPVLVAGNVQYAAATPGGAASPASAVLRVDSTDDVADARPGDRACATAAGTCTLRAAVMEANATGNAEKIVLPPGHFVLSGVKGEDAAGTGDLDVNGGVLRVVGAGPGATTIDGADVDRIFHLGPLATTHFALVGVTLQNGSAVSSPPDTSPSGPDGGGAIRIERDSALKVRDAVLQFNEAGSRGGAVGMPPGASTAAGADPSITTVLTDVVIRHNRASLEGGALFNNRDAFLTRVVIEDNLVDGPGCPPPPASQATCPRGGGIAQSGDLSLTDVVVRRNSIPSGVGGGIANRGDPVVQIFGTLRLAGVTVSGNAARVGGGIANGNGANAFLTNVTISGNTAGGHPASAAAGIANAGTAELTHVTISGNAAPAGGGVVTLGPQPGAGDASTTVLSSVLDDNPGGNCLQPPPAFLRLPTSRGDNLSSDHTCRLSGPGDREGLELLLAPLADNGGPTPTHALLPLSPAIDSVLFNACPPPAADQRGVSRPRGARCDAGAYEAQ